MMIIWVQVWKPKEALSRSDTQLWSAPIPIYQAPKSDNPRAARNSFGAVVDAIVAQAQQRVSFDVSAVGFEMGGKQVCLSHVMMHIGRGAGGRRRLREKWKDCTLTRCQMQFKRHLIESSCRRPGLRGCCDIIMQQS